MAGILQPGSLNIIVLQKKRLERCRKGLHGTAVSEVPGIFGERHELALAPKSGTMINGTLIILFDIDNNINIDGADL
eukprot:7388745-Pyramimonas_sp.AAC.1